MEKFVHDGAGNWAYESYHLSGAVYRRCTYHEGRLEGELTDWFEDGRKRATASYRAGVPHGRITEWSEEGNIVRERDFLEGREHLPVRR